jgi:hypothetical protein
VRANEFLFEVEGEGEGDGPGEGPGVEIIEILGLSIPRVLRMLSIHEIRFFCVLSSVGLVWKK